MKLSRDNLAARLITAYDGQRIRVGDNDYSGPVILNPDIEPAAWPVSRPRELSLADFEPAFALGPELIILGTGASHVFPDARLVAEIMRKGIGFESMSTDAACRTFNVLASEARMVVATLFV